jgi:uncharacterized protein (TIGR03435 family)
MMFERYTEQARRALFFARYEAFQVGSAFIETEHILLGLFREEQSPTAHVLARAKLSVDEVRREIDARTARRIVTSEPNETPFSEEAKSVLAYAVQEADRLLHDQIGTEHLLLGLFREERGIAATILAEQGLQIATVRDQIVQVLGPSLPHRARFAPGQVAVPVEPRSLRIWPSQRTPHDGPIAVTTSLSVSAEGFTLKELIAWAYRADVRHVEMPAELDTHARYDARLDLLAPHSWPALDRFVQEGINRHFALDVTHEKKSFDVFTLTASDGPCPGRRKQDEDSGGSTTYAGFSTMDFSTSEALPFSGSKWRDRLHSIGPIILTATTIADFARWLEEFVGHAVVDETGLAGTYDIEVQGEMQGLEELRHALVEQLALVLTKTQRDLPVLCVYRVTS